VGVYLCKLFYAPGSHAAAQVPGYEDPGGTEIPQAWACGTPNTCPAGANTKPG